MAKVSLWRFLLLVLLLLPLSFALWYLSAPLLLTPVALLAGGILPTLFPHAIETVELAGRAVDIVTRFAPPGGPVSADQVAQLVFSLNALQYGYGIPLLLALVMASPTTLVDKLKRFALGLVVLLLVQVWGLCFEALVILVFKVDPKIALQMGTTPLSRELLALGYQLGFLILPAVTPLVLWGLTHREFLQALVPGLTQNVHD